MMWTGIIIALIGLMIFVCLYLITGDKKESALWAAVTLLGGLLVGILMAVIV